jgi:tetratricopeptide (TPR) repeat protein
MDKTQLLEQVRELISGAESSQALDRVEAFLKSDVRYKTLYREAVQISATFQKTRRDEQKGILSFENASLRYSQVNERLLNLLDYIESDTLQPDNLPVPPAKRRVARWWLLVIPVLFIAGFFGVKYFFEKPLKQTNTGWTCPSFKPTSDFNVMVLPYLLPSGGQDQPQALIVERLENLQEQYNLRASIKILNNYQPNRLLSYDDASDFGKVCNAKMVIWGRSEQAGTSKIIKTRFRFLGGQDAFAFTQLKWQGEKQVDTVKTLSSLVSEGDMTTDIEEVILLVFGVSAKETGNTGAAIAVFESMQTEDSTALLVRNMMLADSYIGTGQKDKALSTYDTLLQVHPDYWLALNNRGFLLMENGDNLGAIEDFTTVLDKKQDSDVLIGRAKAYQQSEQPQKAKTDYEAVMKIAPSRAQEVEKPLEETRRRVEIENNLISRQPDVTATPTNKNEIWKISEANKKLGKFDDASRLLQKGIEANPKDPKFYASKIELLLQHGKKEDAAKLYKAALTSGIKKEELYRLKPSIKKYYEMRIVTLKRN